MPLRRRHVRALVAIAIALGVTMILSLYRVLRGPTLFDRLTGLAITRGEDIDRTRCALIVGRNSAAADPVEWQALKRAKARGARVIVVDPKRIPLAGIADLWLRVRPGTDAALALAMIHVLVTERRYDAAFVERWTHGLDALAARAAQYPPDVAARLTGVAAADIVRAARMYAEGPSTFVSGYGIDAFSAGVQTFRAFHCLVAVSGNVDRPGGNRRVKRPKGFRTHLDLLHDMRFVRGGTSIHYLERKLAQEAKKQR